MHCPKARWNRGYLCSGSYSKRVSRERIFPAFCDTCKSVEIVKSREIEMPLAPSMEVCKRAILSGQLANPDIKRLVQATQLQFYAAKLNSFWSLNHARRLYTARDSRIRNFSLLSKTARKAWNDLTLQPHNPRSAKKWPDGKMTKKESTIGFMAR